MNSLIHTDVESPSLIHVDLWCNNIMFNDSKEMVFIDFQFLTQGDPMFDLGISILLNTNFVNDKKIIKQLLRVYQETSNNTMKRLGLSSSTETLDLDQFVER